MKKTNRLLVVALLLAGQPACTVGPSDRARVSPITLAPSLDSIDSTVISEMKRLRIPGGAVAIVKDGRLVFARAYGYADTLTKRPASVDQLFRIGSVSKPVTAVAVMKLVEDGKLSLEDKPFAILSNLPVSSGMQEDPRLLQITIRDLLTHTSGWDGVTRAVDDRVWRNCFHGGAPIGNAEAVRYGRAEPLKHDPGTHYGYTNYDFQVLGQVIEKLAGHSYEQYVRDSVLAPMGITRMHYGYTPLSRRTLGESSYYDLRAPINGFYGFGSWPDVGGGMEYYGPSGSWLASVIDLMRFMTSVDGFATRPDVLRLSTVQAMISGSLGWGVLADAAGSTLWHSGGADGGDALLVRESNGVEYVALFNLTRASTDSADNALRDAIARIPVWPEHDLFDQYP